MSPSPRNVDSRTPGEDFLAITGTSRCLFGNDQEIRKICDIVRKVSRSSGPVLIRGESGTGKEVLAAAIHHQSKRAQEPFIAVNCAAIPRDLFESELFGHIRGSFTGADRDRSGKFDFAHRGTLFLDEIGDLPIFHQAKLLRVLQSGEITPVGGNQGHKVDVRIVSATNKNLEEMVHSGTFREDLYFRLNLFSLVIPPLRERVDDILPLAKKFLAKFALEQERGEPTFSSEAEKLMKSYPWPGNIRELENAVHFALTMASDIEIRITDLPETVRTCRSPFPREAPPPRASEAGHGIRSLKEVEKDYILAALEKMLGNRSRTARALGISVRSLQKKLSLWNSETPENNRL